MSYLFSWNTIQTRGRCTWPREELVDEQAGKAVLVTKLQRQIEILFGFSRKSADDISGD